MARRWPSLLSGFALIAVLSGRAVGQAETVLDLNTATREQLVAYPGIGQAYAAKIIAARPFKMRSELVSRKIMPATEYLKIKKGLTPTAEDAAAEAAANVPAPAGPPTDSEGRLNLNSASREQLAKVPGIGEAYAAKIVGGRPYKTFDEIVRRNIMPAAAFNKVRQHLFIQ
jgi:DNA uptake protein ComE-like DNA-binding protein